MGSVGALFAITFVLFALPYFFTVCNTRTDLSSTKFFKIHEKPENCATHPRLLDQYCEIDKNVQKRLENKLVDQYGEKALREETLFLDYDFPQVWFKKENRLCLGVIQDDIMYSACDGKTTR